MGEDRGEDPAPCRAPRKSKDGEYSAWLGRIALRMAHLELKRHTGTHVLGRRVSYHASAWMPGVFHFRRFSLATEATFDERLRPPYAEHRRAGDKGVVSIFSVSTACSENTRHRPLIGQEQLFTP